MNKVIGKTIQSIKKKYHDKKGCDSKNVFVLTMTDGSVFEITGGYGEYTGESCDEYVELISIEKVK